MKRGTHKRNLRGSKRAHEAKEKKKIKNIKIQMLAPEGYKENAEKWLEEYKGMISEHIRRVETVNIVIEMMKAKNPVVKIIEAVELLEMHGFEMSTEVQEGWDRAEVLIGKKKMLNLTTNYKLIEKE